MYSKSYVPGDVPQQKLTAFHRILLRSSQCAEFQGAQHSNTDPVSVRWNSSFGKVSSSSSSGRLKGPPQMMMLLLLLLHAGETHRKLVHAQANVILHLPHPRGELPTCSS